jgi:hypothetical protein
VRRVNAREHPLYHLLFTIDELADIFHGLSPPACLAAAYDIDSGCPAAIGAALGNRSPGLDISTATVFINGDKVAAMLDPLRPA